MKIAIILNGISLQKNYFYKRILPEIQKTFTTEVFETKTRNHAVTLASKAVDKQFDCILAAGGDGTIHQVINGALDHRENYTDLPLFGIIPLGGGNDFARSLTVSSSPVSLSQTLHQKKTQRVDVGVVRYQSEEGTRQRYFINVADLGMGPEVVRRVMNSNRTLGSAVAYYQSIVKTFFTYRMMVVNAQAGEWKWTGKLRSMGLAIGKYYGNGLCIAPEALLDDGVMTAFICGEVSVFDFIRYSIPLKAGKFIHHPEVHYKPVKTVNLTADVPCLIEADGEFLGTLPATIELTGRQLRFLVP